MSLKVQHALELAFASTSLRELCEDEGTMVTRVGNEKARALQALLADLRALSRASELEDVYNVAFSPDGHLTLPIANDLTVVAKANHLDNPKEVDDKVDWSAVSRLKIELIGDHQ